MTDGPGNSAPTAPWRIGIDIGGTFTDMVLRDAGGGIRVFKVPSVPANPNQGVMDALNQAARAFDLPLATLLAECELFLHGSTVATNTILERKGARVGMLTTAGFRDSLEIRRGIRADQWDHRAPFPEVLVPRYARLPVRGRIDRDGIETEPLEIEDIDAALAAFRADDIECVAVVLFNSYLNQEHEQAACAHLAQRAPDLALSASSDIVPIMGEYERGSTAVMNAYVMPKVVGYLRDMDGELKRGGLKRSILMLQSNGGAISVDRIAGRPVNLILSGPAAGIGALKQVAGQLGQDNLIAMEIGGTSCDVTLMEAGEVPVSEELEIDGYHLATPSVDIHTVGAGGGTIAAIDSAGMLRMGPAGAGADPGPAAYGRGGLAPTSTDAQLVLGRLRPGPYADGSVNLDLALAQKAIAEHVAGPLGIGIEAAATGMIKLLEQNLLHAVERISIERGYDPANFTLVAAGGAGPMHGASVARVLGCRRVYVPRQAGAFCAIGMLNSDVRRDFLQVHFDELSRTRPAVLETDFEPLHEAAAAFLSAEGFNAGRARHERELDLRYRGQLWSIRVALAGRAIDLAQIKERFEARHRQQFGHIQPDGTIEVTALRVIAHGRIEREEPAPAPLSASRPAPVGRHPVYLDDKNGWRDTPVFAGRDLGPGARLPGPLLIEEETTTVFAGAGDRLTVDAYDNYIIELAAKETGG